MLGSRVRGFALPDVLVALLLLALTLTAACAALVQSMRSARGAWITTRAVDLAADIAEELQSIQTARLEPLLARWRLEIGAVLPVAGLDGATLLSIEPLPVAGDLLPGVEPPAAAELVLRWHGETQGPPHELRMPLPMDAASVPR